MANNSGSNALARALYRGVFRRNSIFLCGVFAAAFAFEIAFDVTSDRIFDRVNRGRQWKDIKDKYASV
ncbi:8525_t:CDS:2 [Paraglomus occultum]|uniref:Complex III subunit 9 n=1 Tax=Paraglomus occultum TaxID=144539 RepID=A0A9N8ZCE5_9GLOM|nr:8525_t:CDS:2 [Paraglomus occultum]